MPKFPEPVPLPNKVYLSRASRKRQILKSASLGISLRAIITLMELAGTFLMHSSTLFTDAIANFADIISTLFLIFCIKLAQRPPDEDHPFGHGRYEPFGGLLLGTMLVVLGAVMFIQHLFGVVQDEFHHDIHSFAWIIPLIAILLLEACYRIMLRTAKKENSPALIADALHYRVDSITSLIALIALSTAAFFPAWGGVIDYVGALTIAVFMMALGTYSFRENFHQLMDKTPDPIFFSKVRQAALRVEGIMGTEKIRIQSYGPDAHVDIDVEVPPEMTVDNAHKISQQVRAEIQQEWPAVRDVTVHIEPYYANDH